MPKLTSIIYRGITLTISLLSDTGPNPVPSPAVIFYEAGLRGVVEQVRSGLHFVSLREKIMFRELPTTIVGKIFCMNVFVLLSTKKIF